MSKKDGTTNISVPCTRERIAKGCVNKRVEQEICFALFFVGGGAVNNN